MGYHSGNNGDAKHGFFGSGKILGWISGGGTLEKIGLSKAINKTAALVVSRGYQYEPNKKVENHDSDTPLLIRQITAQMLRNPEFKDLTGHKFGRFTVMGLSLEHNGGWVVRCQCGRYSIRKTKAALNHENRQDRCEFCRHLAFLKKDERWRRTGVDQDRRDF